MLFWAARQIFVFRQTKPNDITRGNRNWPAMEPVANEEVVAETAPSTSRRPEKKNMRVTDDQREQIVLLHGTGYTVKQIADELGLKRTTVHELLRRTNLLLNTSIMKLRRMKKKRRKRKLAPELLTSEQVDQVNAWLEDDCQLSLQKICERLNTNYGLTVSKSFIGKIIDDFHYSIVRIDYDAEVRNDRATLNARRDYAKDFIDLPRTFTEDQIIFVHMARFNICLRVPDETGKKYKRVRYNTVSCALNKDRVVTYMAKDTATEPEDNIAFFTTIMETLRFEMGIDSGVIILDERELGDEKQLVLDLIQDQNFIYMSLPECSLFLNPIEKIFCQWREVTRRADPRSEAMLVEAIANGGDKLLTPDDCYDCYFTALSYLLRCLHCHPFEELPGSNMRGFRLIEKVEKN